MSNYMETVDAVYSEAAEAPQSALCCTLVPPWRLPGLRVPRGMLERNYGCGSTVNPRDLADAQRVLYVGVGAGMEALQLAYFLRRPGAVIGLDRLEEMLAMARGLLEQASFDNDWFEPAFVELRQGDARELPVPSSSVDVAAQNCLFNIFERGDLAHALGEMHRVLRPGGKLVLSDPVSNVPIPEHLASDPRLRAQCLSGALVFDEYLQAIVDAGFGTIEVRARRPYRVLDARRYGLAQDILLESVEVAAITDPIPIDGACIFTGRAAIYVGDDACFDDGKGHVLTRDIPFGICDKTAIALAQLDRGDLVLTPPTWHYSGDGCC